MECLQCEAANRDGRRFCAECGAPLVIHCSDCGYTNEPGEKFCGACGISLIRDAKAHTELEQQSVETVSPTGFTLRPGVIEPERRQLTVVFCDLVGSTELSRQLDPEDLREVLRAYQDACSAAISRYEGVVSRYMGDGILALFGYPRAHEDDAERAVRAGLGIVDGMDDLNASLSRHQRLELAVRIGIATGLVVAGDLIGEGAAEEEAVVGEPPVLAARLQQLAKPNTVVIGHSTRHLVVGWFECEDLGRHRLKGFPEPQQAWRVVQSRKVESRFEAAHVMALTPLVNREEELALLLHRWDQAKQNEGQVVLVSGEPGVGKSRIIQTLCEHIAASPHTRLRYQSSPHHTNSALHPFISQLELAGKFQQEDTVEEKLNKLEALLAQSSTRVGEISPLFASLLSIPAEGRYAPLHMTPQEQKDKTLAALVEQIGGLAAQRPVLIVFEDAHWTDPTSLDLLDFIVRRIQNIPAYVLISFRPDFSPPWIDQSHVSLVALNRFTHRDSATMVERVVSGKAFPRQVVEHIVAKTDGVPLFVEELTKMIRASGLLKEEPNRYLLSGPLPSLEIPATLHDSLMARLDQLNSAKEVAQIGAAIGREFSYDLLSAVSRLSDTELENALDQLVQSALMFRRGSPPRATYTFKHALVQDAAYDSLLRGRKQQLHARIAKAMEERFSAVYEANPELLAHHYTEARLGEKAVDYWLQAGQRACGRSANVEAVGHLTRGLEVLESLPNTPVKNQKALTLRVTLGPALITTKGPGTKDVQKNYDMALELCSQLPDSSLHFAAFWGWWRISENFETMHKRANKLLNLAESLQDPGLQLQAHHCQWASLFNLGQQEACLRHIEKGLKLYSEGDYRSHASLYGGHDPKVCGHGETGLCLWLLGHPDKALESAEAALAWAREVSHSGSLVHALDIATMLHRYRRDPRSVHTYAEEMIEFTRERGFTDHLAKGIVFRGWALVHLGETQQGIESLREGLERQRAIGTKEDFPVFFDMLAEAYGILGQVEQGLHEVEAALREAEENGPRYWIAELYRRKGELLLALSAKNESEAEACFRIAIEVSNQQRAKSLELRATTTLARLLRARGKAQEGSELLSPVYEWFTEGFETADLKDAAELLEALS